MKIHDFWGVSFQHSDFNENIISTVVFRQQRICVSCLNTDEHTEKKKSLQPSVIITCFFSYLFFPNQTFQRKHSCSICLSNCSFSEQLLWFSCWTHFRWTWGRPQLHANSCDHPAALLHTYWWYKVWSHDWSFSSRGALSLLPVISLRLGFPEWTK